MAENIFKILPFNEIFEFARLQMGVDERAYMLKLCISGHCNPQHIFDKIIAIENDRNVLKKELKYMFKLAFYAKMCPALEVYQENDSRFLSLMKKYDTDMVKLIWTFPDIVYSITKKCPSYYIKIRDDVSMGYKNFQFSCFNEGIFGLLPAGGHYGGFVKAMIHCCCVENANETYVSAENFIDIGLEIWYAIYKSTVTSQKQREKWFSKLNINAADCALWSQIFERKFPKYADIHKRFDQVA